MKTFVIPGIPLCETITGIPRYMYEVLTRLDELLEGKKDVRLIICYPKDMTFVNYNFRNIEVISLDRTKKKWMPQVIKPFAKENEAVICDMADGFCIKRGSIVKIDDVRPVAAKFDPILTRLKFRLLLYMARKNAKVVIAVSESQKKQLRKYLPHTRIEIFPNGYSQLDRFKSDKNIFARFPEIDKNQYYYTLGSLAKHKNFKWIYEVALRNPDKQFVVAGNQDLKKWGMDSSDIQAKNIVYVGYVSDNENKALYENCKVFLHPSYYEGFGMPLLEAVSLGKDLLVSDIPEFREVYGDFVSYLDPNSYEIDLDNIKHIPDEVRSDILKQYSWDDTARMWLNLFFNY